ncbi:MAG TPA: hypothetical protein VGF38_04735 [Ktedonobacterales bacterium]
MKEDLLAAHAGSFPGRSADEERGMAGKTIDAKTQVMRMASLSVSWGILAGIAYLGLIKVAVDYATSQTPWPGFAVDSGIIAINPAHVASTYQGLTSAALIIVPIAVVAVIGLGIAARIKPTISALPIAALAAALLGLVGVGAIFLAQVATVQNGTQFLVALATIVLVAVLVRLQKIIRRFYQRTPALTTLLFAVITLTYLILSNGTSLAGIILSQVHVWLATIAFLIAFFAAVGQVRASRRIGR